MKNLLIFFATIFLLFGSTETLAQKGSLKRAGKFQNSAWSRIQQYGEEDTEAQGLYAQSIEEYKRCIVSNNKKIDEVYFCLGDIYYTAPEPLRDYDEAINCFSKSLKISTNKKQTTNQILHQAVCHNRIGNVYRQKGDFLSAHSNYEKAAALSPQYYSDIATMSWLGLGIEKDLIRAMSLYREASIAGTNEWNKIYAIDFQINECGSDICNNPAIDLYMDYQYLTFIKEPDSAWLPVLIQAAEMDYPPAQTDLWIAYSNKQESDKGLPYLQKAVKSNYLPAITAMGESYMEFGTSHYKIKNFSEGENWLKKAALEGHPSAQFGLGLLYYYKNGIFLPSIEYVEMAGYWFNEAEKQGYYGASYFKDVAYKGLSAKQQLGDDILGGIINIINAANSKNQIDNSSNTSTKNYSSDLTTMQTNQNPSKDDCDCITKIGRYQELYRAYTTYGELNLKMWSGHYKYDDNDRKKYQSEMRRLRTEAEALCPCAGWNSFIKSEWEDWNGVCR